MTKYYLLRTIVHFLRTIVLSRKPFRKFYFPQKKITLNHPHLVKLSNLDQFNSKKGQMQIQIISWFSIIIIKLWTIISSMTFHKNFIVSTKNSSSKATEIPKMNHQRVRYSHVTDIATWRNREKPPNNPTR